MIVNGDYFVGELYLSQVNPGGSSVVANNKVANALFIDEYEREVIEKGLGYGLMLEFYTHINPVSGLIKESSKDTKWDRLLNGHTYTVGNETYYWRGLVVKEGIIHRSMMAYYIYFYYKTNNVTQTTTRGETKGNKGAVKKASVSNKTVRAWRKFIEWYGTGYCYNNSPNIYYKKGFMVEDWYSSRNPSGKVSLFEYMTDRKEEFPDWSFTPLENINRFDI